MAKPKTNLSGSSQNGSEIQEQVRTALLTGESEPERKEISKLRPWIVSGMVMIIIVILGALISMTLTSNSAPLQPLASSDNRVTNSSNPAQTNHNSLGVSSILVGPPDHQIDLGYPGAIPISLNGSDISTPDPSETAQLPFPLVRGAFVTTANLETLENFYSQRIQAAGFDWDSIDFCYPDPVTLCPNTRAFAAELNNCTNSQRVNPSQTCLSTFQISLWFVGANAGPEELKAVNMPQSIINQLIPGKALVSYWAAPNIRERPNYNNTSMTATTAAAVPTPTREPLPTTPIPQSQVFVGPNNCRGIVKNSYTKEISPPLNCG